MQDVLKDYNDIWSDQHNAEYKATKEGYQEAWSRLTERLETDKYNYREDNPYDTEENTFEMGMRMFEEGNIEGAILAFEASTRHREDDSEPWRMLGMCHSEVDDDRRAILALEKAVEYDPYNLNALVALGTSYVNEGDIHRALDTLQSWVLHNPKFQGLSVTPDEYSDGSLTDKLQQLMMAAKEWSPDDADVCVVVGILHNATQDFNFAADSFQEALRIRPESYTIWNKMGATLANNGRSDDAIDAYKKALELRPNFVRGLINMGIALTNLSRFKRAVEYYIDALRLSPTASHVWDYIRLVFTSIERYDLVELTSSHDLALFERAMSSTSSSPIDWGIV